MRKTSFLPWLVVLAVAIGLPCVHPAAAAQQDAPAQAAVQGGQNQSAVSLVPSRHDLEALSVEDLEERGDLYRARKDYLNAIEVFEIAIKKRPSTDLYNKEAVALLMLQRSGDARKVLNKALKLDKNCAEAWANLAVAFYQQKKYTGAIERFLKAIALKPDVASFHSSLGTVYMDRKDYKIAVIEYHRALELDPEVFEHSSPYGVTGKLTHPEERARFDFEMARIFASIGDIEHALKSLRRAMEEGYPDIKAVYKDKEFEKLRTDERFIALMKDKPAPLPAQ